MAGAQHGLLKEHRGITERGVGFAHRGLQCFRERFAGFHTAHAATTATGHRLGENGETDLVRCGNQLIQVLGRLAGLEDGNTCFAGGFQGGNLVSGKFQHFSRGAHERDAGSLCGAGEVRILGQEPVAG